jgi:hypothetical protein
VGAIGVAAIGIGAFLMYEAWRNTAPTPIGKAKATLTTATTINPTAPNTTIL